MEEITLGQISGIIAFLGVFIGGIMYLYSLANKSATKWLKSCLKPIDDKLDRIDKKTDDIDMASSKNFLVRFLADIEQGNKVDEIEKERFYETYEHYIKIGGNSYIVDKVNKLKKENKL